MRGDDARLCAAIVSITTREAGTFQLTTDQCRIVVAVRGADHEARRIVGKQACKGVRHLIREMILLDAVPYVE